jgi:hypothetical protein
VSCPSNPPAPAGFRVWKGPVPAELTQWAMNLRDTVAQFPYGQIWTMSYQGAQVAARKDYHTWTWRNGALVTGICIPGITLYSALPTGQSVADPSPGDPLANPDGTEAVFGANLSPPSTSSNAGAFAAGAVFGGVLGAIAAWMAKS